MTFTQNWMAGAKVATVVAAAAILGAAIGVIVFGFVVVLPLELAISYSINQWHEIGILLGWAIWSPWMVGETLSSETLFPPQMSD